MVEVEFPTDDDNICKTFELACYINGVGDLSFYNEAISFHDTSSLLVPMRKKKDEVST